MHTSAPHPVYNEICTPRSTTLPVRGGLPYHVMQWGEPAGHADHSPLLVMVHGWMDVGASFQFVVDALASLLLANDFTHDRRGFA